MVGARLSVDQRRQVRRLRSEAWRVADIAREVGCSLRTVMYVMAGPSQREERQTWSPGGGRLSLWEREEISLAVRRGESLSVIARRLGRSPSTISREVNANGGRVHYRAWRAHGRAYERARRPKPTKLAACPRLAGQVVEWLEAWWSPEEIARRLLLEFPHDPMMRVSHETIYQSIYVQGRGELRRELARCLRTGRAQRRPRHRVEARGRLPDMVMISERPADVDDRAIPGHWEGDLILGKNGRSAVGTLVERTTGYLLLLHLPDGKQADKVDAAMRRAVTKLPGQFFRTIIWDQGKEMAKHAAFTVDTGIQVYFCDPHSPWQRPSNENTNGLLRQYMPKGTDLSVLTEADLDTITRSLNNRPRKRLNYMKPSERLAELLAMTA